MSESRWKPETEETRRAFVRRDPDGGLPAAPVVIAYPHETMNGVTIHAAAPLSTLPERRDEDDYDEPGASGPSRTSQQYEAELRAVASQGYGLTFSQGLALLDTIDALRAWVSSLEREIGAVRSAAGVEWLRACAEVAQHVASNPPSVAPSRDGTETGGALSALRERSE